MIYTHGAARSFARVVNSIELWTFLNSAGGSKRTSGIGKVARRASKGDSTHPVGCFPLVGVLQHFPDDLGIGLFFPDEIHDDLCVTRFCLFERGPSPAIMVMERFARFT